MQHVLSVGRNSQGEKPETLKSSDPQKTLPSDVIRDYMALTLIQKWLILWRIFLWTHPRLAHYLALIGLVILSYVFFAFRPPPAIRRLSVFWYRLTFVLLT